MSESAPGETPHPSAAAPRYAFTQGVGTIYQFTGVTLFLGTMFICCASSLLGKDTAQRQDLTRIGWHLPRDLPGAPAYSAQRAISISVVAGLLLGMAIAGLGLGLQATRRSAPPLAIVTTALGAALWMTHAIFFAQILHSLPLTVFSCFLALMMVALGGLAVAALAEIQRHPPPPGHELLPADYKVPYSHLHQESPKERLAAELIARRQRLEVEQKELEALERRLRRTEENEP